MKHLKQASKTLAKTLEQHCKHMQNLDETLANIRMKHLKHLKYMLATCMYMQHPDLLLQHLDKTLATFVWNR